MSVSSPHQVNDCMPGRLDNVGRCMLESRVSRAMWPNADKRRLLMKSITGGKRVRADISAFVTCWDQCIAEFGIGTVLWWHPFLCPSPFGRTYWTCTNPLLCAVSFNESVYGTSHDGRLVRCSVDLVCSGTECSFVFAVGYTLHGSTVMPTKIMRYLSIVICCCLPRLQ